MYIRRGRMKGILLQMAALVVVMGFLLSSTVASQSSNKVNMTLVRNARRLGAYCLDGSLPAYHLDRGFGSGAHNWLLQFEGGGWCNDVETCIVRAGTRRGSTHYMGKQEVFSGILTKNASLNPDFYNWNRVKIRYCDGGSFVGNSQFYNGTSLLYFRGQRIWQAIIHDLLPKGLKLANKALLSGCSAGGLAVFHHCDSLATFLPRNATVKCMSDAGFFLDIRDITLNRTMRSFYDQLVELQGIEQNLNTNCTASLAFPKLCFFPQHALRYIKTPFFILNSAYDVFQFHHALVPPSADPQGHWRHCWFNVTACSDIQLEVLQGLRVDMILALLPFYKNSTQGGTFINSCFAHCQSEIPDNWYALQSPTVHNKSIAQAVGDWYYSRRVTKLIDYPYPCDTTCKNLI